MQAWAAGTRFSNRPAFQTARPLRRRRMSPVRGALRTRARHRVPPRAACTPRCCGLAARSDSAPLLVTTAHPSPAGHPHAGCTPPPPQALPRPGAAACAHQHCPTRSTRRGNGRQDASKCWAAQSRHGSLPPAGASSVRVRGARRAARRAGWRRPATHTRSTVARPLGSGMHATRHTVSMLIVLGIHQTVIEPVCDR